MADTGSYSIEERLVASVWVHERQHTGQTMSQVMALFGKWFNKAPPWRATLLDWEKWAFALRSIEDRPRSGRRTTCLETWSGCPLPLNVPPMKSTWKRSSELGVSRSTMRDHMKKDLNVRLYRPTFVNELSDGNMDRRYESCCALLDPSSNAVSRSKVRFSDECGIYRSACDRNVVFWSKENPNFTQELEHNYTITPKMIRRMSQRTWRHIRLCPASRWTYGFTGHVTKAYVIQIKLW